MKTYWTHTANRIPLFIPALSDVVVKYSSIAALLIHSVHTKKMDKRRPL